VGTSDAPIDRTGHLLAGSYRIEKLVGFGAMGSVWAVRHLEQGTVAVAKIHEAELAAAQDDESQERFLREAILLSAVRHANVVALYEVGETAKGEPFLIMEKLEGEVLSERIARSIVPVAEALGIGIGVLAGLAAVHAAGILHRDVKPDNVFLARARNGFVVKLLDFGLARGLTGRSRKITRAGTAVGTPGYMSPEQARGREDLDMRSDLYSVGVVLYEMLAGHPPFEGGSATDIMFRACTEDALSIAELRPDLDPFVSETIMRALARERSVRHADAEEMKNALWTASERLRARDTRAHELRASFVRKPDGS
jgi:eukaryotic-like serine/threonine-protein kinase